MGTAGGGATLFSFSSPATMAGIPIVTLRSFEKIPQLPQVISGARGGYDERVPGPGGAHFSNLQQA